MAELAASKALALQAVLAGVQVVVVRKVAVMLVQVFPVKETPVVETLVVAVALQKLDHRVLAVLVEMVL